MEIKFKIETQKENSSFNNNTDLWKQLCGAGWIAVSEQIAARATCPSLGEGWKGSVLPENVKKDSHQAHYTANFRLLLQSLSHLLRRGS